MSNIDTSNDTLFDLEIGYVHLSGVTLVATYVTMLLGAYTSAIGAGLSCPDWPTCYGTVVPFLHPTIVSEAPYSAWQIFAEWAHRGVAMTSGLLIFATAVAAWRWRSQRIVVWSAVTAAVLLPVQVVLGGLTVTRNLQPVVVTAHLGTAILILVSLTISITAVLVSLPRTADGR